MADHTAIEWADATFNPWIGCTKVSPACDHCYAAVSTPARALGVQWGAGQPRRRTSAANWKHPLRWERDHAAFFAQHGRRRRVFCASLADVFDNEVPDSWRADLFSLIRATPNLDWLLLTKRIGNAVAMCNAAGGWSDSNGGEPLPNVWLGITVANQAEADRDIPKLLQVPAAVRFLSCEPLLEALNIRKWLDPYTCADCGFHGSDHDSGPDGCSSCGQASAFEGSDNCTNCGADDQSAARSCPECGSHRSYEQDNGFIWSSEDRLIDWVIAGGESGSEARPMHPDWVRMLRDQCAAAGVPFLFKQWGEWLPWWQFPTSLQARVTEENDPFCNAGWDPEAKAWDIADGPLAMCECDPEQMVAKVGKKSAGRLLDGVEHNGFPEPRP